MSEKTGAEQSATYCEGWDELKAAALNKPAFQIFENLIFGDAASEAAACASAIGEKDLKKAMKHATRSNEHFCKEFGTQNLEDFIAEIRPIIAEGLKEKISSPVNKAIANALAQHWVALETLHGVPELPMRRGHVQKTDEWKQHEELHHTRQGKVIFDLLYACCSPIIMAQAYKVANAYKIDSSVLLEDGKESPHGLFQGTLFRYKPDTGATFFTYLTMRLQNKEPRRKQRGIK